MIVSHQPREVVHREVSCFDRRSPCIEHVHSIPPLCPCFRSWEALVIALKALLSRKRVPCMNHHLPVLLVNNMQHICADKRQTAAAIISSNSSKQQQWEHLDVWSFGPPRGVLRALRAQSWKQSWKNERKAPGSKKLKSLFKFRSFEKGLAGGGWGD